MKIPRHRLKDLLINTGADPAEAIREAYSGRGMLGATCLGLSFEDESKWEEFIVELVIWRQFEHEEDDPRGSVKDVIARALKDNLGTGVIVYWRYGGLEMVD